MKQYLNFMLPCFATIFLLTGCKKLIEVSPPSNFIPESEVFSSDALAIAAAAGMYSNLINTPFGFSNCGMTFYAGMSADELSLFILDESDQNAQFRLNALDAGNGAVYNNIWLNAYTTIYRANAIIGGLNSYSGVGDSLKNHLIGEAEFIRAFCNFYLVNLFGKIPLVTTTNYHKTSLLSQSPVAEIYAMIREDLADAATRLGDDYNNGHDQRIIPNKYAALALLARTCLFKEDYASAVQHASLIIAKSEFYELEEVNSIFLKDSKEAIWQLQQDNSGLGVGFNATFEGFQFIPPNPGDYPFVIVTTELLQNFKDGDQRKSWIDSGDYSGTRYYYPYKYKTGAAQAIPNGAYTEYYMVLRLAEQYLIRAEAYAHQNKLEDAIKDINKIRGRAGLAAFPYNLTQAEVLNIIEHERQIEFFAEWGHRWLDLKRWGKADARLGPVKGQNWQTEDQLYPIPQAEIQSDPNLTQNAGY